MGNTTNRLVPIPPLSVVRLARADRSTPLWQTQIGRVFRVGYYGTDDGLDCIWLVNDDGTYEQTTGHSDLYRYFDVIAFGETKNWYGRRRPQIGPVLRAASGKAAPVRRSTAGGSRVRAGQRRGA